MSDSWLMDIETFAEMVRNSGLNIKKPEDMDRFQKALDDYSGNDINGDLPWILARAASMKPGTEILQDWNDAHQPADTTPAPRQAPETPQRDRSGFDILEAYNRDNPL